MAISDDMPLFYTPSKRPEPINLAVREVIPWRELEHVRCSMGTQEFAKYIKRRMCQKIAAELVERCAPFMVEDVTRDGQEYQIEIYLSDRGAYEHWLPQERRQGQQEGYKHAEKVLTDSLPYGLADAATEAYV